jgi:hypothetical protein
MKVEGSRAVKPEIRRKPGDGTGVSWSAIWMRLCRLR